MSGELAPIENQTKKESTGIMGKQPSIKMIKTGNKIAKVLLSASVWKAMGGLGGQSEPRIPNKFKTIVSAYIAGDIEHVTAIYLAMENERK